MRKVILPLVVLMLAAALQVGPAVAQVGSDNIELLANIPHAGPGNGGSDLEFADLVLDAGTEQERTITVGAMGVYGIGMHLYDVTDPTDVQRLSVYPCNITQGDVQVFTRDDLPGRTFATYTSDTVGVQSPCYEDATALGDYDGSLRFGTFVVEITDPYEPETIAFIPHAQGSHNMTVHPSGRYLYNSNSDLIIDSVAPAIEITDITDMLDADAELPRTELELPVRPGLGTESHDVTFSADGNRAYSAAISQTVIINTEDPMAPSVITSIFDPTINVHHQSDPITIDDPVYGEHHFLLIEDEFAGALGGDPCPSGGVHVYEIQDETQPIKLGYWNISDARYPGAEGQVRARCTAHVFQLHEEEALMTIAFYNGGVRVVDLSGLVGVALGDTSVAGMREVAYHRSPNSDSWAVKAPFVDRDGEFHMYSNDQDRGLDVYEVDLSGGADAAATGVDVWMDAATAAAALPQVGPPADYTPFCLLGDAPRLPTAAKALTR